MSDEYQPTPSTFHFMPMYAPSRDQPVSFSTNGQWVELAPMIGPYTAGIFVYTTQGDSRPLCRLATFRCFPRANPLSGGPFQMRMFSYYYDEAGQRVYDDDWPIVNSTPGNLGNCSAWVQGKINAMAQTPGNWKQFNMGVKVMTPSGLQGQLFGARLELQ